METLPDSFWIAGQNLSQILDPTMPQFRGFDGRIPPSVLLREPTEEALHLPFDLCWIPFHPILLDPVLTPEQGYYVADNPGSYGWPYPKGPSVARLARGSPGGPGWAAAGSLTSWTCLRSPSSLHHCVVAG